RFSVAVVPEAGLTATVPAPVASEPLIVKVPSVTVVAPVYVLAPENVHAPVPSLVSAVAPLLLSTILPANSPVPEVEPCTVSVFAPAVAAVRLGVNFKRPVPD